MDARSVVPMWIDHVESTVWVERMEASSQDTALFDPWHLPGEKMLFADGNTLSLIVRCGRHSTRWIISAELREGDPFAYRLSAGPALAARLRDLQRHLAALDADTVPELTFARPNRAAMVHMRTLQALDGALAGATQRDIASAVFGSAEVVARWHPDSELRAQVRHLLRRGRRLMGGDYRQLLEGADAEAGRGA